MTDEELLQQALDALISVWNMDKTTKQVETIQAIKARLAQPEPDLQEIIAKWIKANTEHREWYICPKCSHQTPRWKDEWVGLTDEELSDAYNLNYDRYYKTINYVDFLLIYEAVEAKLKEKNNG